MFLQNCSSSPYKLGDDYVRLDQFERVVLPMMLTGVHQDELVSKDAEEDIMRAFEALDIEKKGYIETDKLVAMLKSYGEPFDDEEIKEFLEKAEDVETHTVRYEDYVAMLAHGEGASEQNNML